jgi:hypothetical protein
MDASFTAAKFNFGTASSPRENGFTRVFTREYEYHFIEYEYEKCKAHRPSTVWRRRLQT